ncbi:hypothetical protein BGZ65_004774, partial [Modicella reniformis]
MIYAYMTKCCPRLRDISIRYSDLNFELESGLCLLSELKDLEKLVLATTASHSLTDHDLDWLSTIDPRKQPMLEKFRHRRIANRLKLSKQETQWDLAQQHRKFELHKQAKDITDTALRQ